MRMQALVLLLLSAVPVVWAGPVTLMFDDVITSSAVPMPSGYGGLNWENMRVVRGEFVPDSGYERGVVSASNVAVNPQGNPASFSLASGTFDLTSFHATAAWSEGLEATFTGFLGAVQVYQHNVLLSTLSPTLIELNWSGINRVEFSGTGGVDDPGDGGTGPHIVLDNLMFADLPVSQVPEAGTAWLLGVGLIGLLWRRRTV